MNAEVLVLNGFTNEYLNKTSMENAMRLLIVGKARLKHAYDFDIHTGSGERAAPSVIELLYYVAVRPQAGKVSLSRKNVLMRDEYLCQYCGKKINDKNATIDHVMPKNPSNPKTPKGRDTWENLVASCQRCNQRKMNRTPEEANMPLKRRPFQPDVIAWNTIRKNTLPEEWLKYLTTYHKEMYPPRG